MQNDELGANVRAVRVAGEEDGARFAVLDGVGQRVKVLQVSADAASVDVGGAGAHVHCVTLQSIGN